MLRHVFREERVLLMQVCVKTADVSHPCKPLDIHMQWTQFISEEFFLQGDREVRAQRNGPRAFVLTTECSLFVTEQAANGTEVSALCNRHTATIPNQQKVRCPAIDTPSLLIYFMLHCENYEIDETLCCENGRNKGFHRFRSFSDCETVRRLVSKQGVDGHVAGGGAHDVHRMLSSW
jgi:hypothetical protein